jgi:hypothetical protein
LPVLSGAGVATINGGTGVDNITGAAGSDSISGGAGNDTIYGGSAGSDTLSGGDGDDTISAITSSTTATASTGMASIDGGAGNDIITGGGASNTVNGGAGNDSITGGAASDTLNGDAGNDTITGGGGADTFTGGAGIDNLVLGAGVDTIILGTLAADADNIGYTGSAASSGTGLFVKGSDKIDLSASLTPVTLTIGTQIAFDTTAKATTITSITTAANTDAEVYYIKNTAGHAQVLTLAEIETAITAGSAATGQVTLLIDDGTNTAIYVDQAAQTDAGSGAGLLLVGTLYGISGVTALATGDLISA